MYFEILRFFLLKNKNFDLLDSYREWSNEEIQQFEEGLTEYGKNFFKVTVFKVTKLFRSKNEQTILFQCSNRTVREVIHFYYQWKKTERFQLFMEEQQRMNAITSVTYVFNFTRDEFFLIFFF